jgi:hypothetical protein
VDGQPLAGPHLLADGDHVDHDGIRLRYECLRCGL